MKLNTDKHLIISGILFTVVLILWPIFMVVGTPEGTIGEQLVWISENITLNKIQFFFAFLISPAIIYLMIIQLSKLNSLKGGATILGLIFLVAYLVLNSISYASQIILIPNFIENDMLPQAKTWYFGSFISIAYFLNQLGYCFWGVAAIILFSRFFHKKGLIKILSIIYFVSGILSVFAFFGLMINNTSINKLTVISGLLLVPIGIISIILANKTQNKY